MPLPRVSDRAFFFSFSFECAIPRYGGWILLLSLLFWTPPLSAGAQLYEPLADAVREALAAAVADAPPSIERIDQRFPEARRFVASKEPFISRFLPDSEERRDFLYTLWYEAQRVGLDPDLILAVVYVESRFRKYALSTAGARGYMQVMPFWVSLIGAPHHNLFHLRTNLRYGTVILRHYLDLEKGDLRRALARYNGTLDDPTHRYSDWVLAAWSRFRAAP